MNDTSELYTNWIIALRNGQYLPGKHLLRRSDNSFCCLGVLCDISKKGEWSYTDRDRSHYTYNTEKESRFELIPKPVQSEVNLYDTDGGFNLNELSEPLQDEIRNNISKLLSNRERNISLTTINDSYKGSRNIFKLIADILDERPPSLFDRSKNYE